jgi:hypothetical protein
MIYKDLKIQILIVTHVVDRGLPRLLESADLAIAPFPQRLSRATFAELC